MKKEREGSRRERLGEVEGVAGGEVREGEVGEEDEARARGKNEWRVRGVDGDVEETEVGDDGVIDGKSPVLEGEEISGLVEVEDELELGGAVDEEIDGGDGVVASEVESGAVLEVEREENSARVVLDDEVAEVAGGVIAGRLMEDSHGVNDFFAGHIKSDKTVIKRNSLEEGAIGEVSRVSLSDTKGPRADNGDVCVSEIKEAIEDNVG